MPTALYSVVCIRSKERDGIKETEREREARWFVSLDDAKKHFKRIRTDIRHTDGGHLIIWESKYLYQVNLDEKAIALFDSDPRYDPERLAWELKLNHRDGSLLDQEGTMSPTQLIRELKNL
jgi:hypothetical protein